MTTTNDERGYNGWTNWETWNLNLWIDNDEMLYRLKQTFLSHHHESLTVEDVEGFCRDILPVGTPDMDSPQDMDSIHNDMDVVDLSDTTPEHIASLLSELDRDFCLRHIDASDLTREHACFYMYCMPGGRWDYVIRPDDLLRIIANETCWHLREGVAA